MRTIVWITAAVFAAIYVAIAFATVDRSTDQARIDALIARGVTATQNRDLTTIVSCLSHEYRDGSLNYDKLRMVLAQAMQSETEFAVHTSGVTTSINGNRAVVRLHVRLTRPEGAAFYDRDLTLRLAKEDDRHMLVAPTKTWRVISCENLGLGLPDAGI